MPKYKKEKKHIHLVLPERPKPEAPAAPAPIEQPAQTSATPNAEQIAAQLGETKPWPKKQIGWIIKVLGLEQAQALVQRAQDIEAAGGMLTTDGRRRRTVGGIFFFLCYEEGKPLPGKTLRRPVWPLPQKKVVVEEQS